MATIKIADGDLDEVLELLTEAGILVEEAKSDG